jgi:hypothetical protein
MHCACICALLLLHCVRVRVCVRTGSAEHAKQRKARRYAQDFLVRAYKRKSKHVIITQAFTKWHRLVRPGRARARARVLGGGGGSTARTRCPGVGGGVSGGAGAAGGVCVGLRGWASRLPLLGPGRVAGTVAVYKECQLRARVLAPPPTSLHHRHNTTTITVANINTSTATPLA